MSREAAMAGVAVGGGVTAAISVLKHMNSFTVNQHLPEQYAAMVSGSAGGKDVLFNWEYFLANDLPFALFIGVLAGLATYAVVSRQQPAH